MKYFYLLFLLTVLACNDKIEKTEAPEISSEDNKTAVTIKNTSLVVLGTVQDAGSPHIACNKDCCKALFDNPDNGRKVVSLGVIDPEFDKKYLFEATPDVPEQMKLLKNYAASEVETPDGIFVTHAHIGHYAGLMYLGKEAMNASQIPVFTMPRMKNFLAQNGPWEQLVTNKNILLEGMTNDQVVKLTPNLKVIPFTVPHRDEYSETVGYTIVGPSKSALFIPDIDKWDKWGTAIIDEVSKVDYAFLDATFYDANEVNNRDISEIPHPFIIESMKLFESLPSEEKDKIHFIHFNHTNPALNTASEQAGLIKKNGFHIAQIYDVFEL
ncbi:MBL fold metallo-hydrolase [Gillisia sp. M10.2A]|uniref:MBL fold metallo-hydrolase n=1 Tax=Gillisia lutea TaxID=2909668 RepID=A0ABS9EF37_9FLAO|nr:MBL fold metallo-hydrolase [Gillisia lutea]MCF4100066.1 MBL fold metallo-hydrolase [Gillisia lutea]